MLVFQYQIDDNAAQSQMNLNKKVMENLGPATQTLSGIGAEAFDTGNSMMMIRKGNKLVRIVYMSCPCNTEPIKPSGKKLVADL